jgi:Right handed beta helix region
MKYLFITIFSCYSIILSSAIINIPADQPTIQEGINVSVDSDTILVQPGTYFELINYNGKNITVASQYLTTQDTAYISQTIIDGNNNERVVSFINGETENAKLIGLTIKNGYGTYYGPNNAGGAGIYILNSSPSIEYNIIEDNCSYWYVNGCGIGMQNSSAKIRNNIIKNNDGGYNGGGIYVYQSDNVEIEKNIISEHLTQSGNGMAYGAGICVNLSNNITISKNLFFDNSVDCGRGSSIAFKTSSGIISGNTIYRLASNNGISIYNSSNSTMEIENSVLWSDELQFNAEIYSEGYITISFSNIKSGFDGIGNISRDPLFSNVNEIDFHLTLQSSCINSGNPASPFDPDNTRADMGFYNFDLDNYGSLTGIVTLSPGIGEMNNVIVTTNDFCVTPYSDGNYTFNLLPGLYDLTATLGLHNSQTIENVQVIQNNVTSNVNFNLINSSSNILIEIKQDGTGDFTTIQEGIDAAISGDTILVNSGTFIENIQIVEKNIILGSLFMSTADSSFISNTILDGNSENSVIFIQDVPDSILVIDGFTIRNGNAVLEGGGIYSRYSSPTIINCILTDNYSDPKGGGIYCEYSTLSVRNCLFQNNTAYFNGGGIASRFSTMNIFNNIFTNNNTIHDNSTGGGLYCYYSIPNIEHCHFTENTAPGGGGAIQFMHNQDKFSMENNIITNNNGNCGGGIKIHGMSAGSINNNLITGNQAIVGGGIYIQTTIIDPQTPNIINSTISNNQAEMYGGGVFFAEFSNSDIINTIIWGNESDIGEQICLNSWYSDPNFYYSDIESGFTSFGYTGSASIEYYDGIYENNINIDPIFTNIEENTFALSNNSPCIDAGMPDTLGLNLPATDLIGNMRIWDGDGDGSEIIDMGAYEYGAPPYVDVNEPIIPHSSSNIYSLSNYPNPFNPSTSISFELSNEQNEQIGLVIYNLKGQRVKDLSTSLSHPEFIEGRGKTMYSVIWSGDNDSGNPVSSGIYFYKLKTGNTTKAVKKCLLLK